MIDAFLKRSSTSRDAHLRTRRRNIIIIHILYTFMTVWRPLCGTRCAGVTGAIMNFNFTANKQYALREISTRYEMQFKRTPFIFVVFFFQNNCEFCLGTYRVAWIIKTCLRTWVMNSGFHVVFFFIEHIDAVGKIDYLKNRNNDN